MLKKAYSLTVAVLLALSLGGVALAEEIRGTLSKADRSEITVKSRDGKEVTLKVSGSRTAIEGGSRDGLKEGMKVQVEHAGGEAQKIKISEGK
jgi:hypothetical protein